VVKKVADSELLLAIRAVHAGRTFVDLTRAFPPSPHPVRVGAQRQRPKDLSQREREVLRLLAHRFAVESGILDTDPVEPPEGRR